jgi:hypothetical protein
MMTDVEEVEVVAPYDQVLATAEAVAGHGRRWSST